MHDVPEADVLSLRERNKQIIIEAINSAFLHREHRVKEEKRRIEQITDDIRHAKDGLIVLGEFVPSASMAVTSDSHDYLFLLEKAWEKLQQESGHPMETLSMQDRTWIQSEITRMLTEEYFHSVPIEGINTVKRYFGIIFFEEENGEFGITPIMAFGGEVDARIFADIYSAPPKTSAFDTKIQDAIVGHI